MFFDTVDSRIQMAPREVVDLSLPMSEAEPSRIAEAVETVVTRIVPGPHGLIHRAKCLPHPETHGPKAADTVSMLRFSRFKLAGHPGLPFDCAMIAAQLSLGRSVDAVTF